MYNDIPQNQLCTTIDAPLPAEMELEYPEYTGAATTDPNNDLRFLGFVQAIARFDAQGSGASRFIGALRRAVSVWNTYWATNARPVGNGNGTLSVGSTSNTLSLGLVRPQKSAHPNREAKLENCYAEMQELGLCPEDADPDIPVVEVPGHLSDPEPAPYIPPVPELPPYEPDGGGGGGGTSEPNPPQSRAECFDRAYEAYDIMAKNICSIASTPAARQACHAANAKLLAEAMTKCREDFP